MVLRDHGTNQNFYISPATIHQTWQNGDLPWEVLNHEVTWSKLKPLYLPYHSAYGYHT